MKTVIIKVNDSKGRHRSKQFDIDPKSISEKSIGYMVGYIQACQDNGHNVTIIEETF